MSVQLEKAERTRMVIDRFLSYDWSVLADNARGEIIGLRKAVGPVENETVANELYHEAFEAEPDIYKVIYGESNGVVEFKFIGKHTGEFCGVPATGKTVNVPAIAIYDVDGDLMSGVRLYLPIKTMLEQIQN